MFSVICILHLHVIYNYIFSFFFYSISTYTNEITSHSTQYISCTIWQPLSEIGSERVLISKTVACLKATLLNKNESGHFQFVLLNRDLKYYEYCKQAKKELFANAISLCVISPILHQGIAVLHSKRTWIMSDNINHCHLHLVYVSDNPKTRTFFSIEPIPLDDPFHPDHPDNSQPRKEKAGGAASTRYRHKSSSLKSAQEPSLDSKLSKDIPDKTLSKPEKKACPGTIFRQ